MKANSQFTAAAIVVCLFLLMYVFVFRNRTSKPSSDSRPAATPANAARHNTPMGGETPAREKPTASGNEGRMLAADESLKGLRQNVLQAKLPQWQQVLDLTKATIIDLPPPAAAPNIAYVPDMNSDYHYVTSSITNIGQGEMRTLGGSNLSFEKQPDVGMVITEDYQPGWIMANSDVVPYIVPQQQRKMALVDGKLFAASQKGDTTLVSDTPVSQAGAQTVLVTIPAGLALKIGTRWTTDTQTQGKGTTWEVAGYASVNDVKTVKIVSDCDTTDSVADVAGKSMSINNHLASRTKVTTYIAIDTGMIVRSESTMTMTVNNRQSETQTITQLVQVANRGGKGV